MKTTRPFTIFKLTAKISLLQLLFVCCIAFTVSAKKGDAQAMLDRQISVSVTNTEVQKVLSMIEEQLHAKFSYAPNNKVFQTKITCNEKKAKLKDFLTKVLKPLNIDYTIIADRIVLFVSESGYETANASGMMLQGTSSNKVIKGIVTDSTGQPLAGASVLLPANSIGTSTDGNGHFTLSVPDNATMLEVSFVGYITQSVSIKETDIVVVLKYAGGLSSDVVVVTALGISKQNKKIGYAVSTVNGDLLNKAKEPNIANSLVGRAAGLSINSVNSGPGSSSRILIRGISNFSSGTGPLIVINGIPMDNSQNGSPGVYGGYDGGDGISSINPDDVENIVILKGSAASALYGTRASNGVIQITTKSGKGARGYSIEFSSNFSVNQIVDNTNYQKAYGEGVKGQRPQVAADLTIMGLNSWGELYDGAPTIGYDGKMHPYRAVKDQLGKFYRVAPVFSNTLSFINGWTGGNMRFSISALDNESVIPNSDLKRYSGNLNITQDITSKLKLLVMTNYTNEHVKNRPFLNDMSRNPNFTMAYLPGNIDPNDLKPGYDAVTGYEMAMNSDGYQTNPWFASSKFITNTARNRVINSAALRYDFNKSFYLQTRLGLDYTADDFLNVEPTGTGYSRKGGLSEQSKAQRTELNMDILGGYSTKLNNDLGFDIAAGGNIRKNKYEKDGTKGQQWKTPFLYTVDNLTTTAPIYQYAEKQTNSAYYTFDVSYKDYLTLSTTGRYDVFSTLPAHDRGIFTPSVSGSFLFNRFLKTPAINFGKLRVSYAQTSGEADPYLTSVYYQIQSGTNGGLPIGNTLPQTTNVNGLKPYRMKEFEIGTEIKFFQSRLGINATYFNRKTRDELISKSIGIETGYSSTYVPLGSTSNKGLELEITGTPVARKQFQWNVSFNFTLVDNKLVSLGDTSSSLAYIVPAGQGQYRPSVGPYNNGAFVGSVQGLAISQIMAYDYKYGADGKIIVGDNGIPVRGDLKAWGSGLPKYYGGLNNEFIYKQFNLSFLVDYRFGNKVLSGTDFLSIYYGLNKKTLPGREKGILVDGMDLSDAKNRVVVNAEDYYKGLVTNVSAMSVFDGSFIKLRQVVFGYTLTAKSLQKTPFESINVAFTARNLLTLVKHTTNFDPEDNFSSLPGNAGLEGGGIPQTRTYGISLNVKFKK